MFNIAKWRKILAEIKKWGPCELTPPTKDITALEAENAELVVQLNAETELTQMHVDEYNDANAENAKLRWLLNEIPQGELPEYLREKIQEHLNET